jgi:hypothetical protein
MFGTLTGPAKTVGMPLVANAGKFTKTWCLVRAIEIAWNNRLFFFG